MFAEKKLRRYDPGRVSKTTQQPNNLLEPFINICRLTVLFVQGFVVE